MHIQIINGPNLNLVGKRERTLYGANSFDDYLKLLRELYNNYTFDYYQSNVEGEIINKIQKSGFNTDGIVLNAGGYTHTSVAIADAIKSVTAPVIEVHITNILSREPFRHTSLIATACKGSIMGFGLDSYRLAVEALRVMQKK